MNQYFKRYSTQKLTFITVELLQQFGVDFRQILPTRSINELKIAIKKIGNRVCLLTRGLFQISVNFMFHFSALKILLQTEEDKLTVALNNGLMSLADVSPCSAYCKCFTLGGGGGEGEGGATTRLGPNVGSPE